MNEHREEQTHAESIQVAEPSRLCIRLKKKSNGWGQSCFSIARSVIATCYPQTSPQSSMRDWHLATIICLGETLPLPAKYYMTKPQHNIRQQQATYAFTSCKCHLVSSERIAGFSKQVQLYCCCSLPMCYLHICYLRGHSSGMLSHGMSHLAFYAPAGSL